LHVRACMTGHPQTHTQLIEQACIMIILQIGFPAQ